MIIVVGGMKRKCEDERCHCEGEEGDAYAVVYTGYDMYAVCERQYDAICNARDSASRDDATEDLTQDIVDSLTQAPDVAAACENFNAKEYITANQLDDATEVVEACFEIAKEILGYALCCVSKQKVLKNKTKL